MDIELYKQIRNAFKEFYVSEYKNIAEFEKTIPAIRIYYDKHGAISYSLDDGVEEFANDFDDNDRYVINNCIGFEFLIFNNSAQPNRIRECAKVFMSKYECQFWDTINNLLLQNNYYKKRQKYYYGLEKMTNSESILNKL